MPSQSVDLEGSFDSLQIGQIESLELSACNANQASRKLAGLIAQIEQTLLHRGAVGVTVLIAQYDEAGAFVLVRTNPASQLFLQILLAFERDAAEKGVLLQHPGAQGFQHGLGRRLFQQKHEFPHRGSTPSKKPCFHR